MKSEKADEERESR